MISPPYHLLTLLFVLTALLSSGCRGSVAAPYCGDGIVQGFEECDPGDADDDRCDACRVRTLEPPLPALPLTQSEDWQWFPIEGTSCRNGSTSGFSVRLGNDPQKVLFYFEGGGACFELVNCTLTADKITELGRTPKEEGIFDRREENPFRDWTFVYFPYCTGDAFAGTHASRRYPGVLGRHNFVGATNVETFLGHLEASFSGVEELFVTGESAGGLAALANARQIQASFPGARMTVLTDSAPPLSTDYIAPCLQEHWADIWGFERSVLPSCGADCNERDDYIQALSLGLAQGPRAANVGVFSFANDPIIGALYRHGANDCAMTGIPPLPSEELLEGLKDLREEFSRRRASGSVYVAPGSGHECVGSSCFYDTRVDGVPLVQWVNRLRTGRAQSTGG